MLSKGERFFADDYGTTLTVARGRIGFYYDRGLGVPQNHAEAASWYLKAINTKRTAGTPLLFSSYSNLGLLYAYGLGVPQDRARARELLELSSEINHYTDLLRLFDNNALPKTMEVDPNLFSQEVSVAIAKLNEADARNQAEKERQYEAGETPQSFNFSSEERRAAEKVVFECITDWGVYYRKEGKDAVIRKCKRAAEKGVAIYVLKHFVCGNQKVLVRLQNVSPLLRTGVEDWLDCS
jgi:hypothetical protein